MSCPSPLPGLEPLAGVNALASFKEALLAPVASQGYGQLSSEISRPRLMSMIAVPATSAWAFNEGSNGGWQVVGGRRRGRSSERNLPPPSSFKELLFRKARGRCFKCLSPGHRVATCRNSARCLLCGDIGHKARWCRGERGVVPSSRTAPAFVPASPSVPASAAPPRSVLATQSSPARAMEAPGAAEARPALVRAAASRSPRIAQADSFLTRLGVVAVVVGWCPDLELPDIRRGFERHFRLPDESVQVSMLAAGEFLLVFGGVDGRNAAVQWQGAVTMGRVSFLLSPWTRFRGATAGRLNFKVRVCIEGVPADARNVEAVRGLFDDTVIIDSIDDSLNSKEDSACCKVWIWMARVEVLARRGQLELEEPLEVDSPLLHYPELGIEVDPPRRYGPVRTLKYDVLLHLDRVIDFSSSPPSSPECHASPVSDISGMPSESSAAGGPTTWAYRWKLGAEDGSSAPPPRVPALSRLCLPDGHGDGGGDQGGAGGLGGGHGPEGRDGAGRSSRWDKSPGQWRQVQGQRGVGGAGDGDRRRQRAAAAGGSEVGPRDVGPMLVEVTELQQQAVRDRSEDTQHMLSAKGQSGDPMGVRQQLLSVAASPGQTGPVMACSMELGAGRSEEEPRTTQGRAEEVSLLGPLSADKDGQEEDVYAGDAKLGSEDRSKMGGDDGLLFGPHSPRETGSDSQLVGSSLGLQGAALGLDLLIGDKVGIHGPRTDQPNLIDLDVVIPTPEAAVREVQSSVVDPIVQFLVAHSSPKSTALLPAPAVVSGLETPGMPGKKSEMGKRSGRLAAKPTTGLSAFEKVLLVLHKKNGTPIEEVAPPGVDLDKVLKIYTKPLPNNFIAAVTDLVEAGAAGKMKAAKGLGLLAA
uniref:Uncharacterized protein n=1 Tax=Avena sativa TaxID=4498 RepID=A0ACD5YYA3_AVESA